jgi:hypothetical protein
MLRAARRNDLFIARATYAAPHAIARLMATADISGRRAWFSATFGPAMSTMPISTNANENTMAIVTPTMPGAIAATATAFRFRRPQRGHLVSPSAARATSSDGASVNPRAVTSTTAFAWYPQDRHLKPPRSSVPPLSMTAEACTRYRWRSNHRGRKPQVRGRASLSR